MASQRHCGDRRPGPGPGRRWWRWQWLALWACWAGGGVRPRALDPAACSARFDVQRDKIIRTEESRELGARYLSELDVGARGECLRLCCETDGCDVFVYEEKSPGSCYLFACGPPEDFRCKFTAHSNFSSGVLPLSRRLAELQDLERLPAPPPPPPPPPPPRPALRARPPQGPSTTSAPRSSPATSAPAAPAHPPPTPGAVGAAGVAGPSRGCSRYEFECRSGGECVAVYNACDGVPQCTDGSDEAPELGCPPAAPPPDPPASPPARPVLALPQAQDVERGEGGGEGAAGQAGQGAGARWPHRLALAQPQPPRRYPESAYSGHIFSHTGGLMQGGAGAAGGAGEPYAAFEPPPAPHPAAAPAPGWPRSPWPQRGGEGQEGPGGERERVWGAAAAAEWGAPRGWPVPPPQPPRPSHQSVGAEMGMEEAAVATAMLEEGRAGGAGPLHDGPKKGPPPPARPAPASAPASPPGPAVRQHRPRNDTEIGNDNGRHQPAVAVPVAAAAHEHYSAEERAQHGGLSERPPAAVLLLVLGVCMTGALCALGACRGAARRPRRRPPPHDPDYLVNGMYL